MTESDQWPDIPFEAWKDTCAALHLYTQIVGKYRLAHTPWVNHSWHATLYVNADGLTTGIQPRRFRTTPLYQHQKGPEINSGPRGVGP